KDEKALVRRAGLEAERNAERDRLRRRYPVDMPDGRPHELETGKRELRFGLDTVGGEDVHVRCALARVVEQSRLPDARLPSENQGTASRRPRVFQQRPELGALCIAPVKHSWIVRLQPSPAGRRQLAEHRTEVRG